MNEPVEDMVSVVIPTFNHRKFILATLNSVFEQTFSKREVIVVNDGSPDDTADVLRPYSESGRIRYIEQGNAGQAAARNRGLAAARGELIAFLDDDDLWPREKLALQVARLREDSSLTVVGGGVETIDEAGFVKEVPASIEMDVPFEQLFGGSPFWSPGQTLIRASALREVGGFDTKIWGADDLDLWLRLSRLGRMRIFSGVSLSYRIHAGNSSRQKIRMLWNIRKVFQRHLPSVPARRRGEAMRAGNLFLYRNTGRAVMQEFKTAIRQLNTRAIESAGHALGAFLLPAMRDPRLRGEIWNDLLPTRLGRMAERVGASGRE